VIGISKRLGIKGHLTFCVGLPGETKQTVQNTIDFVRSVEPDSVQFSFAVPFPGTAFYRDAVEKGWLFSDHWEDYDGNRKCIVRTQDLSARDLESIKSTLHGIFADKCDSPS
jgi:anaerobic magnesium-protoporphyrin IX monomethyl ester cyclase